MTEIFDNPYDPNQDDYKNETPPMDIVLREAIAASIADLHTWLPAQVTKVNDNGSVDIKILLKRKYKNKDAAIEIPPIQKVLLWHPRGADFGIKLPVAVGDTGIALFCERSLDKWSVEGGSVDPQDSRKHDISDPVFIPGIYPFSDTLEGDPEDMIFHNGDAQVYLKKAGKFLFKKEGGDELLDLHIQITDQLDMLADTLSNDTVNTIFGPVPLNSFAIYAAIKSELDDLKSKLEALKG